MADPLGGDWGAAWPRPGALDRAARLFGALVIFPIWLGYVVVFGDSSPPTTVGKTRESTLTRVASRPLRSA